MYMCTCVVLYSDLCELRDHNELAGEEIEETKESVSCNILLCSINTHSF